MRAPLRIFVIIKLVEVCQRVVTFKGNGAGSEASRHPHRNHLATQAELVDQRAVAVDVSLLKVLQKATTTTNKQQQTTT